MAPTAETSRQLRTALLGVVAGVLLTPVLHLLARSHAVRWLWTDNLGRSFPAPLLAFWTVDLPSMIGYLVIGTTTAVALRRFASARQWASFIAVLSCALLSAAIVWSSKQQLLASTEPWWHFPKTEVRAPGPLFSPVQLAVASAYAEGYRFRSAGWTGKEVIPYDPLLLQRTSLVRQTRNSARSALGVDVPGPALRADFAESFIMVPPPECSSPRLDLRYDYDVHGELIVVSEVVDVPRTCHFVE